MLLWIDGFDSYGTSVGSAPSPAGVVGRKYPLTGQETMMKIRAGRLGGYALQLVYDATCYLSPGAITTNATMVVGCALKFGTFSANQQFLAFYDGATRGMNLFINTSGEISIRRGTTVLETTSGVGISANTWFYLEFKVLCGAAGTYELRINGVDVASDTGVNTKAGANSYHTTFYIMGISVSTTVAAHYDDLYCLDGSSAINNDFLGNMRVTTIRPNADTAANQWTRSADPDNYALVDDIICDDDTTYVEAANASTEDVYDYEASTVEQDIVGIMISTDCKETDANNFTLITVCNDDDDAGQVIGSTNYVTKNRILETVPGTSNAWTTGDIDSIQAGIKVG